MAGEIEVLLVEDNPSDVELTLRALQKRHMANRIMVARDGVEALTMLLPDGAPGPQPKVVLLDLKLPKVNGLEVLRRLKSDERTRNIPVVVLTSSGEGPDIAESYRLGANSYIVKPVDFEAFSRAVCDAGLYWLLLNHPPA
jgi:CheY-like chemotaxis protein